MIFDYPLPRGEIDVHPYPGREEMRLILNNGPAPSEPVVSSEQRTALAIDLPAEGREGTVTVDVLDVRPDGMVWLLGTLTASTPAPARTLQVDLRPFTLPGRHVVTLEQNGRPLPGACFVTVLPGRIE
jgi:hypothetical protein